MIPTHNEQTAVLIVGAGPVGMVLACELLRRGVACSLIDQAEVPPVTSRAFIIHPRTMELFERLGIADAIVERARKLYDMRVYSDGYELTHLIIDPEELFTRYPCMHALPQVYTEEVIRARLIELGGHIQYSTRLEKIEQDEQGVTVFARGKDDQLQQTRVIWLVGCDGAHSIVRKQLGIPFEGTPSETWMIADVYLDWELQREVQDTLYILFSGDSDLVAFPFLEANHWRLLDTSHNPALGTDPAVVVAELTRKVRAAIGSSTALVHDPAWISEFTIQQRHVPFSRVQHVFVAGDSAHSHSPASAQGMNTGVQDAFNLGWKLAQVHHQQAPESLLDTYSAEREPVGVAVLAGTQAVTNVFSVRDPAGRWMRSSLISMVTNTADLRESVLKRIVPAFFELGITYQQSPFLTEHWYSSYASFERQPKGLQPGERVPDYPFEYVKGMPCRTLHEVLNPTEYALLLFTTEGADEDYQRLDQLAQEVQQTYGDLVVPIFVVPAPHIRQHLQWRGEVIIDSGHPYHRLHYFFGVSQPSAYVIRPDGYVAYRDQPVEATRVLTYLQMALSSKSKQE